MGKEDYGYVYVLKNECMPGLVKIGITDNLKERLRSLYNTSVPMPFEAEYVCMVEKDKMKKIEEALHKAFEPDRKNPKREFFSTDIDRIIPILSMFQVENVTDEANADIESELEPEEIIAREAEKAEAKNRRPRLNFYELGIGDGEHLYWKDNPTIFVTVCSERKVIFDGVVTSLTDATMKLKGLPYGVQPTPFWLYNGKTLFDICTERFAPLDI